jgi:phosphomethylpyrimidine synthase
MKITQDVREYAAGKGIGDLDEALSEGLREKAREFREQGSRIYRKA